MSPRTFHYLRRHLIFNFFEWDNVMGPQFCIVLHAASDAPLLHFCEPKLVQSLYKACT